ncbi:hypothetical protein [Clostridium sp. HBUAS56017]|uniref:hypothetical protein n=1 Tax=Clostridium sp. HBUAS56017 TaxID=2571128 RepID=UPI001FA993D9|nr:hypothetical protein [Clostridium sp. HBUAS56017]
MRDRKYKNVRPDLIILDDYQSEDDVRIEVAREKKWKRYSDDVKFADIYKEEKSNRDDLLNEIAMILLTYKIVDRVVKINSGDKKKLYDEISQSISNILHYKEMKICINLFA